MSEKSVNVGLIQMTCGNDKKTNLDKACGKIREAALQGAQIICLQELFTSVYFCFEENYHFFSLAEPIPGPSTNQLGKLAKELEVVIVASLFEKRAQGVYHNAVAVIDADGEFLGKYRKHHIPDDPGFYEKFYFTPGDAGYKVFETRYARIGTLICWDQWYPEAARITTLLGAQILFYPTAIGWAPAQSGNVNLQQYQAWQTIQRGHAIANGVFVVSVNRTGTEEAMHFWGGSFVAGPFGEILYEASHDSEEIHVQRIDLSVIDEIRVHWPFLRDRRIDSYGPILDRFSDEG
ncbi:MAG: carbon-nitrogen hydrolase [Bacteroidales bacterium]|jgi:N-carbamoylputrescine amidase|nr:carbon-nitrogen hydrolase [Bacteroidales bacterium]